MTTKRWWRPVRRRHPLPEALAAIDMALWDLAGRRAGEPVWRLLGSADGGDADTGAIAVNATIGAVAPARAADEAAGAVAAGFRCVKVKVGVGDDEQRLAAVRAAVGPEVAIRVDANGAWTVPQAVESLAALGESGVELCEEPVHGLDGIAAVSAAARDSAVNGVRVAIAIDESARDPSWRAARVCDAVCLKVARCGGISGVVRDAAAARRAGYAVYLASTLDGPLGIAAALHAAAVVSPDRHCGLATLGRFERPDPVGVGARVDVPARRRRARRRPARLVPRRPHAHFSMTDLACRERGAQSSSATAAGFSRCAA